MNPEFRTENLLVERWGVWVHAPCGDAPVAPGFAICPWFWWPGAKLIGRDSRPTWLASCCDRRDCHRLDCPLYCHPAEQSVKTDYWLRQIMRTNSERKEKQRDANSLISFARQIASSVWNWEKPLDYCRCFVAVISYKRHNDLNFSKSCVA